MKKSLLGIHLNRLTKNDILENIEKYLKDPKGFYHIVSVNPENAVIAQTDKLFKQIVNKAQIRIIDGIGIVLAGQILNIRAGGRYPGVDLMQDIIEIASERRMTVIFVGGKGNLALGLADCYSELFPEAKFIGLEGIRDIQNPSRSEEEKLFSIVADIKPHLVFASFGSPYQEKWIWKNRASFQGAVCMGVGGAFDYLAGRISRAPRLMRVMGLEWMYRLVRQPWRISRQLRLPYFLYLVLRQKFRRQTRNE